MKNRNQRNIMFFVELVIFWLVVLLFNPVSEAFSDVPATPVEIVKAVVNSPPNADKVIIDRFFSRGLKNAMDLVNSIEACSDWNDGDLITGDQGIASKELLRANVVFDTGLVAAVKAHIRTIGEGLRTEKDVGFVFLSENGLWKIDEIVGQPSIKEEFSSLYLNTIHSKLNVMSRTKCK